MKPRTYRRIRRGLYLLMIVVFLLLYLLIRGDHGRIPAGNGWGTGRDRALGNMLVSDVHSSGFIVDGFTFDSPQSPADPDFSQNVLLCTTSVRNEGSTPVKVTLDLYGTDFHDDNEINPGLHTACYQYSGSVDPVAPDYAAFLSQQTPEARNMTLYRGSGCGQLMLQPNETRNLVFFFWVDDQWNPLYPYSVTAKLISRAQ